ncbi:MAG: hypothetical protein KF900_08605 [Bacteroidetes bacterium]|nr:hypothetical protein [Bacteroidota bacterium]
MRSVTYISIGIICVLFFSQADCKKKECHNKLVIYNKDSVPVILGHKQDFRNNKCNIGGITTINAGDSYTITRTNSGKRFCWENSGETEDFYIIDANHYNEPTVHYSCDSIEYKNKILKHYVLTADDIKKNNFTITYP